MYVKFGRIAFEYISIGRRRFGISAAATRGART